MEREKSFEAKRKEHREEIQHEMNKLKSERAEFEQKYIQTQQKLEKVCVSSALSE